MTVLQHPHLARRLAYSYSSYTDFPTQADYHDTPEILLVWARIVVNDRRGRNFALWGTLVQPHLAGVCPDIGVVGIVALDVFLFGVSSRDSIQVNQFEFQYISNLRSAP